MLIGLKNKKGFTLAEVLITLGIIGVVAAITIPTLIANINGARYRSGLKKAVSTLSQAVKMNKANYGYDFASVQKRTDYTGGSSNPENGDITMTGIFNSTLAGASYLGPLYTGNYKITTSVGKHFNDELYNTIAYSLSSGTIFTFNTLLGVNGPCSVSLGSYFGQEWIENVGIPNNCYGFIDVNGKSLPNKEVKCSVGEISDTEIQSECIVKDKDITDVFRVYFHDGVIEPGTNATRYVLQTAK